MTADCFCQSRSGFSFITCVQWNFRTLMHLGSKTHQIQLFIKRMPNFQHNVTIFQKFLRPRMNGNSKTAFFAIAYSTGISCIQPNFTECQTPYGADSTQLDVETLAAGCRSAQSNTSQLADKARSPGSRVIILKQFFQVA
jgi:hypothetical protein